MATEQVSPVPETQIPETDPVETEVKDATPEAESKSEETAEQIELRRLQRELKKAQRNNSRLFAEAERLKAEKKPEEPVNNDLSKDAIEKLAIERARHISSAERFAESAERIVEAGKKLDPKFMEQLNELRTVVGDFVQPNGLPSPFMKTVLEVSENPTKLLHHLAKNPDVADELVDLSTPKLAARLDRIERSFDTPTPKTSSAPKPLEPLKPSASTEKDPEKMTYKEFVKWRRATIAARR